MAFITPILAAVLHVAGSLMVVFNSFRLVRSGEELEPIQQPASQQGDEAADPSPNKLPSLHNTKHSIDSDLK